MNEIKCIAQKEAKNVCELFEKRSENQKIGTRIISELGFRYCTSQKSIPVQWNLDLRQILGVT